MFQKINLKGLGKSSLFGYAADLPAFKGKRAIAFKPGLNILWGPNASGKSTLLRILSDTMCATQGGVSAVTESSIRDTVKFGMMKRPHQDMIGLEVVHDGQPVMYCDPRRTVGMVGGHFDDDFFAQGLNACMTAKSASHGTLVATKVDQIVAVLMGKEAPPAKIDTKVQSRGLNEVWSAALDIVTQRLVAQCEPGQQSILLDEPETNFSLKWQSRLWKLLASPDVATRFQVIVASHSSFALRIPGAHYIDLVPGYREEVEMCVQEMVRERFMR